MRPITPPQCLSVSGRFKTIAKRSVGVGTSVARRQQGRGSGNAGKGMRNSTLGSNAIQSSIETPKLFSHRELLNLRLSLPSTTSAAPSSLDIEAREGGRDHFCFVKC